MLHTGIGIRKSLYGASILALFVAIPALSQTIDGGTVVTVPGSQSSPWNIPGSLSVGNTSTGTLSIGAGGIVSSGSGFIGRQVGAVGTVTVSGAGAQWTSGPGLNVGNFGNGSLNIANGGRVVSTTNSYIGTAVGSTGAATVSGAGSLWTTSGFLRVGQSSGGTLNINNGGAVSSGQGFVGYDGTGNGTVAIDGAGSQWTTGADLVVGFIGNGQLNITNGGTASSAIGTVGTNAGATGAVKVDGAGSAWNNSGALTIGNTGTGSLTISNSGVVSAASATVAANSGSQGAINIGAAATDAAAAPGTLTLSGAGPNLTLGTAGVLVFNHTDLSGTYQFAPGATGAGRVDARAGATTLIATNTYTGGTTIHPAATLQLGNGGTSGSILGNVANNGTLIFNRSNSVAFPGLISGTGQVNQVGAGTTILTANNTYSGGTTITAGTLQLGNGGTTGAILGNVTNNGTLAFNRSDSVTFPGLISGTGQVNQIGTGTTILTADNTYSGGTTITAGTLQLGNSGTTGAILGNVTNNGALAFNRSDSVTFPGLISGTGQVNQIGTGATILTADNTYSGGTTIAAGTLQLGNGGTSGAILGNVTNNGTLSFNRSDTVTFAGAISGTGIVNQNGSGTTIFTSAANTYSGATNVNSGVLSAGNVNTLSPNSTVSVASTGVLALNGNSQTVAGVTNAGLINMGTGTPPGTTLTTPNYGGLGGTLAINTYLAGDGAASDRLVVNGGTANGSSFLRVANAGGPGALTTGNGILVVNAINGATTTFGAFALAGPVVAGPYEYTLFRSSRDASSPQSWYLRSDLIPIPVPPGPGPGPGPGPDPTPTPTPTPDPGPGPSPAPTPSPAIPNYRQETSLYAALPAMQLIYGRTLLDSLHERVGELRPQEPPALTEERSIWCADPARNNRCTTVVRLPDREIAASRSFASLGWARIIATHGNRDGGPWGVYRNGPNFDYDLYGLQAGLDLYRGINSDGSRDHAGIYAAIGRIEGDVTHFNGLRAGRNTIDAYSIGGYWTHFGPSGWYLDGVVQGTWYDAKADSRRGFSLSKDSFGFGASLEGGYPIALGGGWIIEPQAQLIYQTLSNGSASDGAALVRFSDGQSLAGRVGARLAKGWELEEGAARPRMLTAWLKASVWNEFLGDPKASFSSATGFIPFRSDLGGTWGEVKVGIDAQTSRNTAIYASAGYSVGFNGRSHAYDGRLGLKVTW
ncbi:MAG TPA: autotransporter outer membrane beta-barrel domain-containing protein [Bosea sp. (in: a-proteobacteria)]|uniref:autotransporter outer membrane beta-barrel domain-containing protein n=1 Tax=Bosea sp. (in: a-proteobacteria) TaxID=1871050 RepID=UPI002E138AEC|nr:autotransporter outer membrane beta-barrel domain-containing protein [Bosea sp. (in: a-proteobacteria)]